MSQAEIAKGTRRPFGLEATGLHPCSSDLVLRPPNTPRALKGTLLARVPAHKGAEVPME